MEPPVFHLLGNKNWFRLYFRDLLKELPSRIDSSLELFGGTGILSADISESGHFSKILYNDDDMDKVNFFEVLQKSHGRLNIECQYYSRFPEQIQKLKQKKNLSHLERAVLFWCKKQKNSFKNCMQFPVASVSYANVIFTATDAFKCLKKHINEENRLILCDSPYIYTRGYEDRNTRSKQRKFDYDDFKRLAKNILKAKGIFLLFCRVTASRSYHKSREQQNTEADSYIRGKIDDCFMDKELFYRDFDYDQKGTIERVIANYPFSSFQPYNSEPKSINKTSDK